MLTYIPSIEALERFKVECKHEEANLLTGKCQLCIDALLFMTPISMPHDSLTSSLRVVDEIAPNIKSPLVLSGDEYLLDLIRRCPSVKIIYPSSIPFSGFVDLSLLESCISLELVRIPFSRLTGVDNLRNHLRSLVWIRGYNDEDTNEEIDSSLFTTFSFGNGSSLPNNLKVDEIFWDQFGTWPLLSYLCISQSNISHINASTMPPSIKTLDLRMNRIYHFSNLANYSLVSTITKLCLDYNSLKDLPKLNDNTCSTLVHLSLRGNLIESVVGLRNFASLDYLDLSENSICDLRQLLSELIHLSNVKTVYIEKNPVSYNKSFTPKCHSVLHKLVKFNGNSVKRALNRANYNDAESVLLPININETLMQASTSSNRYGTFLQNADIEDSTQTDFGFEDSFDRARKSKASKERFVVINDQGEEESSSNKYSSQQTNVTSTKVEIEIKAEMSRDSLSSKKNYLFGGVSGSYGSFHQLAQAEAAIEVSSSLKSQHLTEELIEAEKNKLLQKRMELGDDWLISDKEQTDRPILININAEAEPATEVVTESETTVVQANDENPQKVDLDETSEWDEEDTEDENTVFLVEIYSNETDLKDQSSGNYLFIRVRPRDGLLFEKDCTSGKILTTLDLKILEQFQYLPRDCAESESIAVRLLFDTTIASKRERIYRFVEEDQCPSFVQLYLTNYGQYKFEAELTSSTNATKLLSTTPLSRSGNYSWFYMCLRCGYRTHRIITDCSKCGSDLIIKDEGSNEANGSSISDFQKMSTPLRSSTPNNESNSDLEVNDKQARSASEANEEMNNTIKDNTSMLSEENFENEPSQIDENYFKANIDHYLKLLIEIYIYEQIEDNQLKSESIESICHCMALNFASNSFTPVLVVFTFNYIFVFDYKANSLDKQSQDEKEAKVQLHFYRPLAGPRSSRFIISHLPGSLKNQAFWLECGSATETKKADKKKKRKRSKTKQVDYVVELLLFDDKCVGKAFLQLFLHSHRTCLRSQQLIDQRGELNLIVIKADITELTHVDEDDFVANERADLVKRKVMLSFDEACQKLLHDDTSSVFYESPYSVEPIPSFESPSLFLAKSFNLVPSVNGQNNNGKGKGARDGLFKVEQNLVFLVTKESLAICKMNGNFSTIGQAIANIRSNESIAKALQSSENFDDRIEFRLLMKDLILNLLPNIYIDKSRLMLVLRFRDEDHQAINSGQTGQPNDSPKLRSGLIVYDFQIQFNNQNTLKRATKLIQTLWEDNFGVSITLSKLVP